MSKIKVLVLSSTYPRWRGDTIPGFVHRLNQEFSKLGLQTIAIVPHCSGAVRHEFRDGVEIYRFKYFFEKYQLLAYSGGMLNTLSRWFPRMLVPFYLISQFIQTLKLAYFKKVDLLHAHWVLPQGLTAVFVSKLLFWRKIPVLVTVHGGDIYGLPFLLMLSENGFFASRLRRL